MFSVVAFMFILVCGLAMLVFVLWQSRRGDNQARTHEAPILRLIDPLPPSGPPLALFGQNKETDVKPDMSLARDVVPDVAPSLQDAAVSVLEQKCRKLEQLLEEKNFALARLEGGQKGRQDHHEDFEVLKNILQKELEELKLQNKKLKEDVAQVFQENLALQAKIASLEKWSAKGIAKDLGPAIDGPMIPLKQVFDEPRPPRALPKDFFKGQEK